MNKLIDRVLFPFALIVLCALPFITGCNGLKRITTGDEGTPPPNPQVITSAPQVTQPNFDIKTPDGYVLQVWFGKLDSTGLVMVDRVQDDKLLVFINDVQHWFAIRNAYSQAFYYEISGDILTFKGHVASKYYCIYQYKPIE